jgi:ABC-type antimicrobial peptide transport system permease subunit
VPFAQTDFPASVVFYIRTSIGSAPMFNAIRHKVSERDPNLPIYAMKTLDRQLDDTLSTERMIAALSGAFGLLATLLAAIGLYGVMAFVVARRTKEIGLRMALGASQPTILWMVMRETLLLLLLGLAIGVPASVLLNRYISSQLFGVTPTDIGAAAFALAALFLVALTAGFLPARRASTIDPMGALKYE